MSLSLMVAMVMVAMIAVVVIQHGGRHKCDYRGDWKLPGDDRLLGPRAAIRGRIRRIICGE